MGEVWEYWNDKNWSDLMRIAISNETAQRMVQDGWTAQKVSTATAEDLRKYNPYSPQLSEVWIKNAKTFLDGG
jgi:hypothetical protein